MVQHTECHVGGQGTQPPRSQTLFGSAFLFHAKFHFALTDLWRPGLGRGNKIASANAFPNEIWERGQKKATVFLKAL
jgi:hypothetical protein